MPSRGTDWNSISEPLAQSMDMVAKHMLRQPQIRYRLDLERRKLANETAMAQARVSSEAAQGRNYDAQARGHKAKAVGDEQRNSAFDRLNTGGGIAKLHWMISGTTPFNASEYDAAMSDMTQAFGVSGRDAIELIKQGAQAAAAKNGVPARANAEATGDITSIANNDADNTATAARGYSLSPGARRYDAQGNLVVQNPSAASQREAEYETTTQKFDKQEIPADVTIIPAVPARGRLNPFVENTPAIPERYVTNRPAMTIPERTVTTKKRIGDFNAITAPAANQAQDPYELEMPQDPGTETAPAAGKPLDAATAKAILQEVGGDKQKARELAKQRGYTF